MNGNLFYVAILMVLYIPFIELLVLLYRRIMKVGVEG